jgi:hypothetical protein
MGRCNSFPNRELKILPTMNFLSIPGMKASDRRNSRLNADV